MTTIDIEQLAAVTGGDNLGTPRKTTGGGAADTALSGFDSHKVLHPQGPALPVFVPNGQKKKSGGGACSL
jgi:hypothetical protein